MSSRCDKCEKIINKRTPILQCNKCDKLVHATQECAEISSKQISALRCSDSIEWSCADCLRYLPSRKSYIPPEEESEPTEMPSPNIKKILERITHDFEKTVQKQLEPIVTSLNCCNEKVDTLVEYVEAMKHKITDLEKKNLNLINKNNNLEIRIKALEQKTQEAEQDKLNSSIEITGIPTTDNENLQNTVAVIMKKLDIRNQSVQSVKRLQGSATRNDAPLLLQLKNEEEVNSWIQAAKKSTIYTSEITPNATVSDKSGGRIFIRQALTKAYKTLLWSARQKLGLKYKFIWVKNSKIMAREQEKSKIFTIRSEEDISNLLS